MLIFSRKEPQNTPSTTAASKLREKCPYFKSGNLHRAQEVGGVAVTVLCSGAETQPLEGLALEAPRGGTWLFSCRICRNHENKEILYYILPRT